MSYFDPQHEADISSHGLVAMLERELLKENYFMDADTAKALVSMVQDHLLAIQALPGDSRRGLTIEWSKVKKQKIQLGMNYTGVFCVRLVIEMLQVMKQLKCNLGMINTLAKKLREDIGIKERGASMRMAGMYIKTGHVCQELDVSLETIELSQAHVARQRHLSFQYGPYMTKKLLPKKDIMVMSLRVAKGFLKAMNSLGITADLMENEVFSKYTNTIEA